MEAKQQQKSGWQFDKTISITHMITTASAIAALVGFGMNLNNRLSLIEQAMSNINIQQKLTDERQDTTVTELRRQTREDMRNINDKLDRILERRR